MTPDKWLELQAKYPRKYEANWRDYTTLQLNAAAGKIAGSPSPS